MPVRRLHLLRHAKSSWDDPALSDRERPLNKRGRKACKLIAAHLQETAIEPDAVLVSPAIRAQQTFERISKGLPAKTDTWTEARIYTANSDDLLDLVRELGADIRTAMLIGHNPSIQGLATRLGTDGKQLAALHRKFPTGALATLSFASQWVDLRPGEAELEAFVKPKQLGR